MRRQQLEHLQVSDRLARSVGVERHAGRVPAVTADGASMRPRQERGLPRTSARYSRVERSAPHERLKPSVRLRGAGDDEQTRGVAVEAVHDAGPVGLAAADPMYEQAVDERAARTSGAWMNCDAGGLVDDEQVLVLVRDADARDLLGLERNRALGAPAP